MRAEDVEREEHSVAPCLQSKAITSVVDEVVDLLRPQERAFAHLVREHRALHELAQRRRAVVQIRPRVRQALERRRRRTNRRRRRRGSGFREQLEGDGRRLGPQGGERFGPEPEVLEYLPRRREP